MSDVLKIGDLVKRFVPFGYKHKYKGMIALVLYVSANSVIHVFIDNKILIWHPSNVNKL